MIFDDIGCHEDIDWYSVCIACGNYIRKAQLLWLEITVFSKKALHNIEKHNSAKTYGGILLK